VVCEKESKRGKKERGWGKSGIVETEVGKLNLLCDILRARSGRGRGGSLRPTDRIVLYF